MKKFYTLLTLVTICYFVFLHQLALPAQAKHPADSLQDLFNQATTDTARLNILFKDNPYKYMTKPQQMLALYQRGYVLAQQQNDQARVFKAHFYTAMVYIYNLQDEVTGFQYLQKAFTVAEARKDYFDLHRVYYAMSIVQDHQNNLEETTKYLYKAIEAAEKTEKPEITAFQALNMRLLADKRLEENLRISKRLVTLVERTNSSVEKKIQAYSSLAEALKLFPNKKQEFAYYQEKTKLLFDKLSIDKLNASDLIIVASIYHQFNRNQKAIDILKYILNKSIYDANSVAVQSTANGLLAQIYESEKNYPLSIEHLKRYVAIELESTKQRLTDETGKKIIKFEAERDLLLKQNEVDKNKWFAISGFCMAVVLLLGLIFVYYFYKREQKTKQELAQLNATKDKLFALISHDLMSPLANFKAILMLPAWGLMPQAEFEVVVKDLGIKAHNLYSTCENMLHWAITQMEGMKAKVEKINVAAVINEQINLLEPIAKGKQIDIQQHIPQDMTLEVDKNHFALIIRNLLQNALKFTHTNGLIVFKAEDTVEERNPDIIGKGGKRLMIQDNGIGMSPEIMSQLFQIDKNTNRAGTSKETGTGLGLILTKELVELNRGQIDVTSTVGRGTAFTLAF